MCVCAWCLCLYVCSCVCVSIWGEEGNCAYGFLEGNRAPGDRLLLVIPLTAFSYAVSLCCLASHRAGHGGVADRMDCQIMMGSFMYFYYWAFVRSPLADIGPVMSAFKSLTPEAQLSFFEGVKQHMSLSGLLK